MENENDYDSPGIATIFPLWSKNAEDIYTDLVNRIGNTLKEKNLITEEVKLPEEKEYLIVKLGDYAKKYPIRKHFKHWVDGGEKLAGVHPDTYLPFFINISGSIICKFCDGQMNVEQIIEKLRKNWDFLPKETLEKDLLSFLLLLEELDLVEFCG